MKTKIQMAMLSGLMVFVGAIQPVYASGKSHMRTTGRTSQPIGHYEYCRKFRADCNIRTRNSRPLELTRARWKELVEVNKHSNTTIQPVTDQEYYKVEELWTYPTKYGDCEDYVLMKRHMLMQRGWPASSLLVTVVRQANGDGHAVLTVRTDRADYILDNLESNIKPWNQTDYRYLKRQSVKNSGHWAKISDNRRI
ncbi:MAG: transglutaminase-like cysteine peptidase [Rhizobiaceae bacterium]